MKRELTLADFSKNSEEYQNFFGRKLFDRIRRKNATSAPPQMLVPPPPPLPPLPKNKLDMVCKSPLMKKTKKCKEYLAEKLKQEQERARLQAEAWAKVVAEQKAKLEEAKKASQLAQTQQQKTISEQVAKELAEILAAQSREQKKVETLSLELLKTEEKLSSGSALNQTQQNIVDKILSESTLDAMQKSVAESPILQKTAQKLPDEIGIVAPQELTETTTEATTETTENNTTPEAKTKTEDKKNNMLLYGAIGVGVVLLLFGKKIFGGSTTAPAVS